VADPESRYVADRDLEENIGLVLGARIQTTLKYFGPLSAEGAIILRFQDVPLYNSVFRFDDQMIVTPHLHATQGSEAPALHLKRLGPDGMFERFAHHFESIWETTTEIPERYFSRKQSRGGTQ
jgi:hypothetical protein